MNLKEVTMQNEACFRAVDRTLRDVCSTQILFGGDFAQISPVVKNVIRFSIIKAFIKHS